MTHDAVTRLLRLDMEKNTGAKTHKTFLLLFAWRKSVKPGPTAGPGLLANQPHRLIRPDRARLSESMHTAAEFGTMINVQSCLAGNPIWVCFNQKTVRAQNLEFLCSLTSGAGYIFFELHPATKQALGRV